MMSKLSRQEILQMVAAGHLSADEAAALLSPEGPAAPVDEPVAEQMSSEKTPEASPASPTATDAAPEPNGSPTWLRVQIADGRSGRRKMSVNVPLNMLRLGLKIGRRFAPELDAVDWQEVDNLFGKASRGVIVEVVDEEDGEHVQVILD